MKYLQIVTLFLVGAVACNAQSAIFRPATCSKLYGFYKERLIQNSFESCIYYAKENVTHVYEQPSNSSHIIFTKEWSLPFIIKLSKISSSSQSWLPVSGNYYNKDIDELSSFNGWVAADTVVALGDMKPVIGCWSVSHVSYEIGDAWANIRMTLGGNFEANFSGTTYKGQIYYSNGIVVLDDPKSNGSITFPYEAATKQLIVVDDNQAKIEYFDPAQLQGCGSEPTVTNPPTKAKSSKH
jgi:hypothetical protein